MFNHRCAVRTAYFQVLAKPNELGRPRLGMIVSKRLFPNAVDRNRMRRRIRETFRHMAMALPALDLVVRPHVAAGKSDPGNSGDLHRALEQAAKKCSPAC